ncbi:phosphoglycolate phosphatase [Xanthobacter sp. TB0139]|uniref:phosphoglycolate phosphatase n=1 Tax=Xanthobacter sp. TB0139 TaxID=3459178 RepID=UPI0040394BEC
MNLIFDLDGTLVDSASDIRTAVNMVLADAGYQGLELPQVRSFIGEGTQTLIRRVIAAVNADEHALEHWHRSFIRHYEAVMLDETSPYPGVMDALKTLRSHQARMVICTNKPERPARAILSATGLAPLFDGVVGGDTLAQRKPSPEPVFHARSLLGDGPVFFVGDSEIDAAAAHAAGIPLLLFTQGYRKSPLEALPHQAAFDHFSALPHLVEARLPA